jgi:hypothetical protein
MGVTHRCHSTYQVFRRPEVHPCIWCTLWIKDIKHSKNLKNRFFLISRTRVSIFFSIFINIFMRYKHWMELNMEANIVGITNLLRNV